MTSPIIDTKVPNAAYTMMKELDYGSTYFWEVRATEPVESSWSMLANFTVKEEPAKPVPPLIMQAPPPPIINVPVPPPPSIITLSPPPPAAPSPIAPGYLRAAIIIATALLLVVIALIVKPFAGRPVRVTEGFSDRLGKLREGLATYFKDFNPLRTFRGVKAHIAMTDEVEASQPISFAAKSFLWMMTSGGKEESQHLLSAEEEQSLGQILATRIQALAKDRLLYQKFPKDAALFLYLWSHYGSRDETNRYLTRSFQSRTENIIEFLKCYLTAPKGLEPGLTRKTEFSRTQYDAVAQVIDPDNVYEVLRRLYRRELDTPASEESGYSSDKALASQFARIHHLVKNETKKTDKTVRQKEAEMVRADAR